MDIFTILVFFLMVNSSDVQIKDTNDAVALPESSTTELPTDTLKLYIAKGYMFFDEKPGKIALNTFSAKSGTFPELVQRLEAIAAAQGDIPKSREEKGRPITILGDENTDYATIQQVLASCAQTSFRDVSLAVIYEEQLTPSTDANSAASITSGNSTTIASLNASSVSQ